MADVLEQLDRALEELDAAGDVETLERVRVRWIGRRSQLAELQRSLRDLDPEQRRELGQRITAFRRGFEERYEARRAALREQELSRRIAAERLDLTLPPRVLRPGRPHLISQVLEEILDAFVGLGYRIAEGPEVEAGVFNFDLLNIPPDHPARQEMDTIYVSVEEDVLLRTHTSPVQARVMLQQPPPIAIVAPGRVYRADTPDATHSPVFTQVEGLYVDRGVSMAHLHGTLRAFAQRVFGPERTVRLRPSMFPFTEPSAEVDVSCPFCSGGPCRICGGTGWLEILGAGMVDPDVLSACGVDPEIYSGFAFGIGVERVAMLRHGVEDIRELVEGDVRFLRAF